MSLRLRSGTRRSAPVSEPTSILKFPRSPPYSLKIRSSIQLCIERFGERLFIASRISSGIAFLARRSRFSPVRTLDNAPARSSRVCDWKPRVPCTQQDSADEFRQLTIEENTLAGGRRCADRGSQQRFDWKPMSKIDCYHLEAET